MKPPKILVVMIGLLVAVGPLAPTGWAAGNIKTPAAAPQIIPTMIVPILPTPNFNNEPSLAVRLSLEDSPALRDIHHAAALMLGNGPIIALRRGHEVAVLPQVSRKGSWAVMANVNEGGAVKELTFTKKLADKLQKHLQSGNVGLVYQALAAQFDGDGNDGSREGNDGSNNGFSQKVGAETKRNITKAFTARQIKGFPGIQWSPSLPQDVGFVRVPLPKQEGFDAYQYTALILISEQNRDPNRAGYFILERSGGLAGETVYSDTVAIETKPNKTLAWENLPQSSALRQAIEEVDSGWSNYTIRPSWTETIGFAEALSGRVKLGDSASLKRELTAMAQSLIRDQFQYTDFGDLEDPINTRSISSNHEAIDKTEKNITEGLSSRNPKHPKGTFLRWRIASLVSLVGKSKDIIAVSVDADTKETIGGPLNTPLHVGLVLFLNKKTGEYAAFYSRESPGQPEGTKGK